MPELSFDDVLEQISKPVNQAKKADLSDHPVNVIEGEVIEPFNYRPIENAPVIAPIHPILRNVDLTKIVTRSQFIKAITPNIPVNEYGLPRYFYRPDLLDHSPLVGPAQDEATGTYDIFTAAHVDLDYSDGFPQLPNGDSFWSQMEFEPTEAYAAFAAYLAVPGARQLSDLKERWTLDLVKEWSALYYWTARTKAYDMFRTVHYQRMREYRIINMEDRHLEASEKLWARLQQALGNKTLEDFSELEIPDLVTMLEKVTKIERTAIGMPANGTKGNEGPTPHAEVILRRIAEQNSSGQPRIEEDNGLDLLRDPDATRIAQELILKFGFK